MFLNLVFQMCLVYWFILFFLSALGNIKKVLRSARFGVLTLADILLFPLVIVYPSVFPLSPFPLPLSSLHVSLSAQGQTMLSALVFSTLLWLSIILALRFCLKLLLSYHQWMFEQHGRVSNTTKVWVVSHASAWYHSSFQWLHCRGGLGSLLQICCICSILTLDFDTGCLKKRQGL